MSPRLHTLLMTTTALLTLGSGASLAGPEGAAVVGGAATVQGQGTSSVIVNQTSNAAIVNWNTFNIGTGEKTQFVQPGTSSVILNRVTGGLGPSSIDGTLTANGKVFLINRDGMLFGPNAVVNTAGFVGTTHDIKNEDFMAGRYNFHIPGRPDASIVNQGSITATSGGFAALVAPGVRNTGTITATLGTVSLASGNMFTLDLYGDKLIQLGLGDEIASQVRDVSTGQPLKSLVSNEGKLKANGGRVQLTAAAARHVVDSVINNKGVIEANSIGRRNGMIVLGGATGSSKSAAAPKQTVKISGTLSAAGKKNNRKGGTIVVTGENIEVANAKIDASGNGGGGKVMIGGDWAGGKPNTALVNNQSARLEANAIPTATTLSVDAATTIDASAKMSGDGGKVILWSDVFTSFGGTILARGGDIWGNGGFVEVSGKDRLAFSGTVDLRATSGLFGTLLLDPFNMTISNNDDFNVSPGSPFTANNTGSNLNVGTLQAALSTANVVVTTGGAAGDEAGNITVSNSVTWASNSTLTLSAFHDIIVSAGVVIANTNNASGGLILRADNSGTGSGTVQFPAGFNTTNFVPTGKVDFSQSTGSVSIYYNPSPSESSINQYQNPTPYSSNVALGSGATFNTYMLVNNATDLGRIGADSGTLGRAYALGKNIDATNLTASIASISNPFTGVFDGNGGLGVNYAIDHLQVGLFSTIGSTGNVRNLNLIDVAINATANNQYLGSLTGHNSGAISNVNVANVNVTSSVNGGSFNGIIAGGLVGQNDAGGTITNSSSAANVTVANGVTGPSGFNDAGGVAGINLGAINQSSASGPISGGINSFVGGLVGTNGPALQGPAPIITASSASGNVSGSGSVGGLVGFNVAGVTLSGLSATGNVTVTGNGFGGGLVGQNEGTIISSQRNGGTITGTGTSTQQLATVGGLVGANSTSGTIQNSSVSNATVNGTFATAGGLVGVNSGNVTGSSGGQVFASGVTLTLNGGNSIAGGLVGSNAASGVIHNANASGTISRLSTAAVSSFMTFGGLVGRNSGSIEGSNALTTVNGGAGAAGGLVGQNEGTIAQSAANGNVSGTGASGSALAFLGGLVGSNNSNGQIASSNSATGIVSTGGNAHAGGLIGDNSASLSNLSTANAVNATGLGVSIGGLIGWNNAGATITNGRATGAVTSTANGTSSFNIVAAGGLIGTNLGSVVSSNPVNSGCVQGASFSCATGAVSVGNFGIAGGLVGNNQGSVSQGFANSNVTGGTFALLGGLVGQNGQSGQGATRTISSSFASGNVSGAGGSSIGGLVGFAQTNSNITGSHASGNIALNGGGWAGGLVGQNRGTIAQSFYDTGTVSGLSDGSNFANIGGLVGQNEGTISNSRATAAVTGTWASAGGLVGYNYGTITQTDPTQTTANATVNIAGDGSTAGGLVGTNAFGGSIQNAKVAGSVGRLQSADQTELMTFGGVAGRNEGSIDHSAAAVSVTGGFSTSGGLVGENSGSIAFSSASGAVNGFGTPFDDSATIGGLVGSNQSDGSISNSTASGNVTGGNGTTAGGLVGFNDFSATISDSHATGNVNIGSMGLSGGLAGGLVGDNFGTVTNSDATGAVSGGEFTSLGGLVGTHQGSIANSHASGNVTGTDAFVVGGLVGSVDDGASVSNSFASGNVTANGTTFVTGGLAGYNAGEISGSYATGTVTGGSATGGLVGINFGMVTGSYATGAVTGGSASSESDFFGFGTGGFFENSAGGLVGLNLGGTVDTSYATGAVAGVAGATAGGLIGSNFVGTVSNSYATGNVSGGAGSFLGGLVGFTFGVPGDQEFAGTISGSHATGSVAGGDNSVAGGFVGVNLFGAINNSYATGAVTGGTGSTAGGFGGLNIGTITTAYASGAVTGGDNSFVGGFAGVNFAVSDELPGFVTGSITQSFALGPTTGGQNSLVAGFAAINVGSLDQTYAGGFVTAGPSSTTGGLAASNSFDYTLPTGIALLDPPGTATNSYWDRQTTGQTTSAGGAPADTAQLAPGLPSGFDPAIWGAAPGQYPFLLALGPTDTTPSQPVLPPTPPPSEPPVTPSEPPVTPPPQPPQQPPEQPLADIPTAVLQTQVVQQIQGQTVLAATTTTTEVVSTEAITQAAQEPQQQAQSGSGQTSQSSPAGQVPPAPQPIRLNAGPGRDFYLPPPGETRLVANEVVLQMPCNPGPAFETATRQLNLTVLNSECLGQTALYRVQLSSGQTVTSAIRALVSHRIVAAAQANYLYTLAQQGLAEPQGDSSQYVLGKLKLTDVHRAVKGTNVAIAVIDSGIDATHPDLEGVIVDRFDAVGADEQPHAHGTGMAGAIGSHRRLMGIAPSARLYAIRAFSTKAATAESTTFNILKGLDWAVNNNVRVVNMSFAGPKDPSLERALKAAYDKGLVLVAAAGNAGPKSPPLYPAADPNVIAVTATDIDDKLFTGANRGRHLAISAPGVDILVPAPEGTYQMTTGTSVATAHISGIVALLLERNPALKPAEIRKILAASAKRLGPNNEFGAGLVDPVKALELAAPRSAAAPAPITR